MMLEVDLHRSRQAAGKHLVYIDFLATAPWNRYSMQDIPDYKGVGSAMLDYAIWRSLELGYGGRIGLHALPDAEGFYLKRNLTNFGVDLDKEYLTYFELDDASD
jgi:hypothetical protein